MSPELLLAGVGGLLVLTGILGGGFEIRELKMPHVGIVTRGVSTVVGLALLLVALSMAFASEPLTEPGSEAQAADERPVTFTVNDELGDGQLSEQVTLVVGGRRVGDLTISEEFPASSLEVTTPSQGRQDYTLSATSRHAVDDGTQALIEGSGQGTIDIDDGDIFDVAYADNGLARHLTLMER